MVSQHEQCTNPYLLIGLYWLKYYYNLFWEFLTRNSWSNLKVFDPMPSDPGSTILVYMLKAPRSAQLCLFLGEKLIGSRIFRGECLIFCIVTFSSFSACSHISETSNNFLFHDSSDGRSYVGIKIFNSELIPTWIVGIEWDERSESTEEWRGYYPRMQISKRDRQSEPVLFQSLSVNERVSVIIQSCPMATGFEHPALPRLVWCSVLIVNRLKSVRGMPETPSFSKRHPPKSWIPWFSIQKTGTLNHIQRFFRIHLQVLLRSDLHGLPRKFIFRSLSRVLFVLKTGNHVTGNHVPGMEANSLQLDDCPLKMACQDC